MANIIIPWWSSTLYLKSLDKIEKAIKNSHIGQSKFTKEFEELIKKKLQVKYCVTCSSGSSALLMSLMALGIKRGDNVIIPNRAWIATAHSVLLTGAKLIIVDVNKENESINIKEVEKKINKKTKAVIAVHMNGKGNDIHALRDMLKKKKVKLIEDAAQSLFSKKKKNYLGTIGDIGCFSLSIPKIITSAQGGFCISNSKSLFQNLNKIKNQGMSSESLFYSRWGIQGFNFKFNDIVACIAIPQIKNYNKIIEKINSIYLIYKKIKNINLEFQENDMINGEISIYNKVYTDNPKRLMRYLAKNNIEARPSYANIDKATYLKTNCNFKNSNFYEKMIILPSGPGQSLKNIKKVITILNQYK